MIRITCPFCGERDHSEFSYGGDATVAYPALDAPVEDWNAAVYERRNPRGPHKEYWHHLNGCRSWLVVERDTLTHEVGKVEFAHPGLRESVEGGA